MTLEMPSPVSGKLLRILAQEGETIPMGAPIAEVESNDVLESTTPDTILPAPAVAPTAPAIVSTSGYLDKEV